MGNNSVPHLPTPTISDALKVYKNNSFIEMYFSYHHVPQFTAVFSVFTRLCNHHHVISF